ncbi:flagellar hook-associated protein FliD [Desulfocucumis palustris]|uniref:Flagellar hook-associated protein 2 n=1 Tax=Desulfocucumis palustris TaxID=1898651 RepID=A0A2L2XA77_9FIRM|nr:flagellar filament capping protein FliD [Desulfocucumis palustris]GBF33179.1 flagellar hook-associated protein FliD [Desulfocucumis palustris]
MSSSLRIGGLVSGFDVDSMVEQLMKARRVPLDKLKQQKQVLEWQSEDYRSMNNTLRTLRDSAFNMKLQSTYLARQATSSNEALVSATASSSAAVLNHTVVVNSLAEGASITGGEIGSVVESKVQATGIDAVAAKYGFSVGSNFSDGEQFTWDGVTLVAGTDFTIGKDAKETSENLKKALEESSLGNNWTFTVSNSVVFATAKTTGSRIGTAGNYLEVSGTGASRVTDTQTTIGENAVTAATKLTFTGVPTEGVVVTIGNKKVVFFSDSGSKYADASVAKSAAGADYAIDIDGKTAATIADAVQESVSPSGVVITDDDNGVLTIAADTAGSGGNTSVATSIKKSTLGLQLNDSSLGVSSLVINGEEITINCESQTIYDLVYRINTHKKDGKLWDIQASYDATLDRLFLTTTSTGADREITVKDGGSGSLSRMLKLTTDSDVTDSGSDASIKIDGTDFTFSSNNATVNGVTYNLKSASPGTTVNVNVSQDVDKVYNAIKDFVDLYNTTITTVQEKTKEKRYKDYTPLTDEQKEEMTENQIEQWEKLARQGLLKNDSILTDIVYKMRTNMASSVSGIVSFQNYDNLADIGIKTAIYTSNSSEDGKLTIDETSLREAIAKDPEGVMQLFTKSSDNYSEKGIAASIYDNLSSGISSLSDKAGYGTDLYDDSTIGKKITEIDDDIDDLEDRLGDIEERYWNQFTAMEQAIMKLNSQSTWLTNMFSSGSNQQ